MRKYIQKDIGQLYLVSAGIGDLDNMTQKAYNIILDADMVFAMSFMRKQYSELLSGKEVYDSGHALFRTSDDKYSDKEKNIRSLIRNGIKENKKIVIMDFGDPVLYGPHSGYLTEFSDLNPEVIPGISSFNAANAALGIEITQDYNRSVIITEAMSQGFNEKRMEEIAKVDGTIVIFSMRLDINKVVSQLSRHFSENTPAAIVCTSGFKEKEKIIYTHLRLLPQIINNEKLSWDYILYIGKFLEGKYKENCDIKEGFINIA